MEFTVKIHNGNRFKNVENYTKDPRTRINRPHAYYKCFTYLQIPRIMSKLGYDYKTDNQTLK